MHRTTTTATLLVTVAVTALSGCVTIQHPTAPGPPPAPSQPSAPRPEVLAEPQIVQAPAREALELIGPDRRPTQAVRAPQAPRTPGEPHRSAAAAPPPPTAPAPAPPPRRAKPRLRPPKPERRHTQPRVELPEVSRPVRENTDVCALGMKYGGWGKGSPQTVICKEAYGR